MSLELQEKANAMSLDNDPFHSDSSSPFEDRPAQSQSTPPGSDFTPPLEPFQREAPTEPFGPRSHRPPVPTWLYIVTALAGIVLVVFLIVVGVSVFQSVTVESTPSPHPATATPFVAGPTLITTPITATPGISVTVFGSKMMAGDQVSAYLRDPATPGEPILPVGTGQVAPDGTLALSFTYPTDPRWTAIKKVDIIVQSASTGGYLTTSLNVQPIALSPTPSPTPSPTWTPTASSTPLITFTPTPVPPSDTPTSVPITDWQGEYYANPNLNGAPALVRNDQAVDFNWGTGSPAPGIPADNFSVRWTRTLPFEARLYRFSLRADDGVRLWVDGVLLIDEWHTAQPQTYTRDVNLSAGSHAIRIEYYEGLGNAFVQFGIEPVVSYSDWKGEYFNNPFLAGAPSLVRDDLAVSFDWGTGSPGPGVPPDKFSARWTRSVTFAAGVYRFSLRADDGVKFYIDNLLLIDEWHSATSNVYSRDVNLAAGTHNLKIEYYEDTGSANVWFTYGPAGDITQWRGEYFANDHWAGYPVLLRNDAVLNFDWGDGSPDQLIPPDTFSVRWTRTFNLAPGIYQVDVTVDDGVRFYIDGVLLIDEIHPAARAHYMVQPTLTGGPHEFKIEYVEYSGQASFSFALTPIAITVTPTDTPTPTLTPTTTSTPTDTPTPTVTLTPSGVITSTTTAP